MPNVPNPDFNALGMLQGVTTKQIDTALTVSSFWKDNSVNLGYFVVFILVVVFFIGAGLFIKKILWKE